MTPRAGAYALVQACPDRERAEGINVGVVVVAPGLGVATRMAAKRGAMRRRLSAASFDLALLEHELRGLAIRASREGLATAADLVAFGSREAGHLLLTPPRLVAIDDLTRVADELFHALVQPPEAPNKGLAAPKLEPWFDPLVREGHAQRTPSIVLPLMNKPFTAPFGYTNGVVNMLLPRVFPPGRDHALEAALYLGGRGELVARHRDDAERPYHLVIVGAFPTPKVAEAVEELLRAFNTRVVRSADLPKFADEVRLTGH